MKKLAALILSLCMLTMPLLSLAEEATVAQTTPPVHRQDYDHSAVDTSTPYNVLMYLVGNKLPGTDAVVEEINKILSAEYNTTLQIEYLPWSDYQTKYPLILAGGEPCDLIYAASWCYLYTEAAKGSYYEMDEDFIKTNMPMTYANQKEESWGQTTINGVCVGIPCNMMVPNYKYVGIRQDLAEKYGIQSLNNWDDFMNYMITIAEKETPVSGIYALDAAQSNMELWRAYCQITNQMSVYSETFQTPFQGVGVKPAAEDFEYAFASETFLNFAKEMKKLADAGCWSRSALSNTSVGNYESFGNLTGATEVWNGTIFNYMHQAEANEGVRCEAYDLSPESVVFAEEYNNSVMCISANSENPERAALVADLLGYDYELNLLALLGLEGVNWEDRGNGYYFSDTTQESYPACSNALGWWCKKDYLIGVYDDARREAFDNNFKSRMVSNPCTTFVFDESPVKAYMAAVTAVKDEYFGALTLGLVDDVEATFNEMLQRLETAGLSIVKAEFDKQYNEWLASGN